MKSQSTKIERRIRLAGMLLIAGLLVELVTLRWSRPTAFRHFALVAPDGVPFVSAAGRLVDGVGNRRLPHLTGFRRKQTTGRVIFLSDGEFDLTTDLHILEIKYLAQAHLLLLDSIERTNA